MSFNFDRDDVERVEGCITNRRTDAIDDSAGVELSITRAGGPRVWRAAAWESAPGRSRQFKTVDPVTFSPVNFPQSTYEATARITNGDERILVDLGTVRVS